MDVGGVDFAQALVLALQMIGAEIYSSTFHKSGNLFWKSPATVMAFRSCRPFAIFCGTVT